jgi:ATP diphosphatase
LDFAEAHESGAPIGRIQDEIGDLLFAVANLARHLGIDPEGALRSTNAKFIRRFGQIEKALAGQNRSLAEASLDEMEALWQAAKLSEIASS